MAAKRNEVHKSMLLVLDYIEKRGIKEADFAREMGFAQANLTNWKRRGIPLAMREKIAGKIGSTASATISDAERALLPLSPDEIAMLAVYRAVTPGHQIAVQNFLHAISRGRARDPTMQREWPKHEERRARKLDS